MTFKDMQEFKEKTKGLNKDQLKEFLDNLTEDEQDVIRQAIIMQHKIHYTFKDHDFTDYTEDEDELNKRVIDIEDAIKSYKQEDLDYTIESLLNPYILRVLAHCIKDTNKDLDADRLNDLIRNYNKINDFINNNDEYDEVLGLYGDIVNKHEGFYYVNDAVMYKVIEKNDLNIEIATDDDIKDIKNLISDTWDNKKEILDPSKINDLSEQQHGITFKQFIFCEEYIKRGKIKPTCDFIGISRNTAYLWLDDTKVQEYLKKRQDEIKKETDDTFIQTYRASFNQLNKMINGTYTDTTDRIKAIDVFLKHYENIERLKQPQTTYED